MAILGRLQYKFFYHGSSLLHFQAYKAHFNSRKCMGGQHAAALFSNGEIHMSLCPAAWRIAISRRASWQERWHKQTSKSVQMSISTSRLGQKHKQIKQGHVTKSKQAGPGLLPASNISWHRRGHANRHPSKESRTSAHLISTRKLCTSTTSNLIWLDVMRKPEALDLPKNRRQTNSTYWW